MGSKGNIKVTKRAAIACRSASVKSMGEGVVVQFGCGSHGREWAPCGRQMHAAGLSVVSVIGKGRAEDWWAEHWVQIRWKKMWTD